MKRATGYLPDPAGHKRTPFRRLSARLASAPPPSASLFAGAPPVMDQGESGSCTGHATACGLYIALRLPWVPSPAEIYRNGRAIDRDSTATPLEDNGAQPNQVLRAINEFGIRPMVPLASRFSDADPATINDEPKLGDIEAEAQTVAIGDYGITSTGAQRVADIKQAIANGVPVAAGIAGGSDAFQAYTGGVLPALHASIDHYIVILSYETMPDGSVVFGARNSWGDWGESGNVRLSEAAVQELEDLIALADRKAA